jgi:colanic acid/amylovoran biosynthesis protein
MKRITLVNVWHDDNKGDSAIVIATIGVLRAQLGDSVRFGLLPMTIADEREFAYAYRHVRAAVGEVEIAPCLLPTMRAASSRAGLFLSDAIYLCRLLAASLTLRHRMTPGARLIAESELVICTGGHKFHARQANPLHLANLYSHLAPLLVADWHGVPFFLWGHSLGPFHNTLAQRLTRAVLNRAQVIGVRESLSYEQAQRLGLPTQKVQRIPDPAFALEPTLTERVQRVMAQHGLEPERFLAVTVRQWKYAQGALYARYLDNVASLVRALLQAGFASQAAIVVHAMGPTPHENDTIASQPLWARLQDMPVHLITEDFSPAELSAFYGQSRFLIGTRFHSVILAMVAGTPAYAISYFGPKSAGIMQDMGLSEWIVPLEQWEPTQVQERILNADIKQLRQHIASQVKHAQQTTHTAVSQLLTSLCRRVK